MTHPVRFKPAALALAGLLTLASFGCRGAEPQPPVKAEELAEKAAAAELAARPREAAELYLKAAVAAAEASARQADPEQAAAAVAETEFLAEKGYALAEARQFRRTLVEPLRRLAKALSRQPNLEARISWWLANCLRAAGEDKAAGKEFRKLGFVSDWQIIGPFDNERGQGFSQAYEPEKELDLAKKYPGKKRKVAWMRNPCAAEDGYVDLAGMLRPNQEAVAYLLTWLHVGGKKEVPAAVRLASDDGVRVWLNGREVWKQEASRPASFDQDGFGVVLAPGPNALLVKVAQGEGDWGLRLRLTDPAGAPLKDVEARADRAWPPAEPSAAKAPEVERGALDYFARRAAAEPKDAGALLRLGFLTARLAAFDREKGEPPDRKHLDAAVKAEPANARLWYELASVAAYGGGMKAETDENPRRRALEQSAKLAPAAAAELELAAHYLRQYRNFEKAGAHLARARTLSPDSLEVRLLDIELSVERGDAAEALAAAAALARANPESARAQLLLGALQESAGKVPAAVEAVAAAAKLDADDETLRRLATLRFRSGQAYQALEAYATMLERRPARTELRAERARLLAGREDYTAAIDECQKGLTVCREDHKLLAQLGEYLAATGNRDRAREAWKQALDLQPNYVELERYLEYVENRVSYDRKYRENAAEILAGSGAVASAANDPAAYLLNKVIDRVYPDGTNSRTSHAIVKILSDAGAKRFAEDRVIYYADEQRAVVRTARVVRPDGREEQARVLPEQTVPLGERTIAVRSVRFPPLSPGDVIEIEYRVDDLEQGFFGKYFGNTFHFRQELPVSRAKDLLIAPAGLELHHRAVRCELAPEVRQDQEDGTAVYTWALRDLAKIQPEPLMPPLAELSPAVEVSTYQDWAAFGKWYWGLVRKQHEPGPEVARLSKELCAAAKTDLDKVRAVYNYVVTDIRYVAWEFGVHGFKPYRAEQIAARKFGDCKDKATLICALLAEQGIRAYPVLIRAETQRGRQDLTLPLISHFNHCIAYLPAAEGRPETWLDGTAQYCSADALLDTDRGARVAVITPEGALVKDIPPSAPQMNTTADEFRLKVAADGSARGTVRGSAAGDRAMVMRSTFTKPEFRGKILSRLHGRRLQGSNVVGVSFSDLRDLNVPVSYSYALDVPALARPAGDGMVLDLPESCLRGVLGYGGKDELFAEHFTGYVTAARREHDVVLPAAWQASARWEVQFPEGLAAPELPPDARIESEFGKLVITRKVEGQKLVVDKLVQLAATRVPAAKYDQFRQFCLAVDRAESERVMLVPRKAGGPDKPKDQPAPEKEGN